MTVVLDTTVLVADPHCRGLAWKVLVHACETWDVRLVIPEVVVVEAVAGYRRRLEYSVLGLEAWKKKQGPLGLDAPIEAFGEALDRLGSGYPGLLSAALEAARVSVVAPPEVPHIDLVNRAARRQRPCDDKGDGYRDTLNWLLVLSLASVEDRTVLWVTDNSKDFADAEGSDLHDDLLVEVREVGCEDRVSWIANLGDAAMQVAQTFGSDEANLGALHSKVRNEVLRAFLDHAFVTDLPDRALSPRLLGLPPAATDARLSAAGSITDLSWTPQGSVIDQRAVLGFVAAMEASLTFSLPASIADADPSLLVFARDADVAICGVSKLIEVHGLLTVDDWERPNEAEVTRVQAPVDDPGRAAWKLWDTRSALADALRAIKTPVIPPDLFKGIKFPVVPPEFLNSIKIPVIPPDLLKNMKMPVIPPDLLKGIKFPVIPPNLLKGINFPVIPPDWLRAVRDMQGFSWPDEDDADAGGPTNGADSDVEDPEPDD